MKKLLEQIGFSDKESLIITTLNKVGPSAASTLARLTSINRVSTYDVLNRLISKNIVLSYKQGNTVFYAIDDINKLVHFADHQANLTREVVASLKEESHSGSLQIQYYKGIEGIVELYENQLTLPIETKEILMWADLDTFYSAFPKEYDDRWTTQRLKNKISARLLIKDSETGRAITTEDDSLNRECRLVPYTHTFGSVCMICDNYLSFFDTTPDNFIGIRIHNKQLATMQRTIFEGQWLSSAT